MAFAPLFALLGIAVGVLLNRAADNLPPPLRHSLRSTPQCPYCRTPRTLLEQSGLVSFMLRRDHCHSCGAPLALRAPLLELGTGFLFGLLAARLPFGVNLILLAAFTAMLLLIAVIDLEHKLVLNVVVLPGALLAVLASPVLLGGTGPQEWSADRLLPALVGAAVGGLITLAIYWLGVLYVWLVNRGRTDKIRTVAFGMGDVKLAVLLGALVGFPAIVSTLVYGIVLGGVGALGTILWRMARGRRYSAFSVIPYGPFLIIAGWLSLVWGPVVVAWLGPR